MGNDLQEILYRNYEKSLAKELIEVKEEERKPSEVGQVRLFFMTPPEFILILKREGDLNIVVPLTSYLQLAITDRYPPLIKWKKFNLVPLPFWVYAHEKLLQKYSVPMFHLKSSLEEIAKYVKEARTKGIGKWREKFIKKTYERFKDLNLSSIIYEIEKEEARQGIVVKYPTELKKQIEERAELALAAQPTSYLKGENWLGVVEGDNLILYLPEDYIGKKVSISLRDEVIYEGIGEEVITIEDIPRVASYTFLEEELHVQVFGN